jgi:hypothetical protein
MDEDDLVDLHKNVVDEITLVSALKTNVRGFD